MSAAPQAPVVLPLKKGIVKQVSIKMKCGIFFGYFHRVPTQHLNPVKTCFSMLKKFQLRTSHRSPLTCNMFRYIPPRDLIIFP